MNILAYYEIIINVSLKQIKKLLKIEDLNINVLTLSYFILNVQYVKVTEKFVCMGISFF